LRVTSPTFTVGQRRADRVVVSRKHNGIRIGLLVVSIGVALQAPWGASIAVWTRRGESNYPVLTYTQLICLGFTLVDAFFMAMVWGVASFRPDEVAAESTRMWNDFGWFLYLWTWPPFSVWCLAIGLGIIWDKSGSPAFPRWFAYYNFWIAFLLIPAGLMIFFKHGPFGFNGLIAFWMPTAVFFVWMLVMSWMLLRAVSAEEARAVCPRAARRWMSHRSQPNTRSDQRERWLWNSAQCHPNLRATYRALER